VDLRRQEHLVERTDDGLEPLVGLRMLGGELLRGGGHLGSRLRQGGARLEAAEGPKGLSLAARRAQRVEVEGGPCLLAVGEAEPRGHDTDDRAGRAVDPDAAPDDTGVAAIPALPGAVAQKDDGLGAGSVLTREEAAAEEWLDPELVQRVGGQESAAETLRLPVAAQHESAAVVGREPLERGLPPGVLEVIVHVDLELRLIPRRVGVAHVNDTFRLRKRQPAQQGAVHDAEHGRRETDAEGQGEHGRQGVSGASGQDAETEAEVAEEAAHGFNHMPQEKKSSSSYRSAVRASRPSSAPSSMPRQVVSSSSKMGREGWRPRAALTCQPQRSDLLW
jgi:hypothetical protein